MRLVIDAVGAPRGSYLCECGRLGCDERVNLTAAEYESARTEPPPLVLAVGHGVRAAGPSA